MWFYIFFYLLHSVYPEFTQNFGLTLQIAFAVAERGSNFRKTQPSLQHTKWFLLSEMRTSNILHNLPVWMGLRVTSKGLWASVLVCFSFCNRLWNGSWHCFSCDIVAWIGTTGLWDSLVMSVQQHLFLLSSAKFYELHHPISEKTQCADAGSKSD